MSLQFDSNRDLNASFHKYRASIDTGYRVDVGQNDVIGSSCGKVTMWDLSKDVTGLVPRFATSKARNVCIPEL